MKKVFLYRIKNSNDRDCVAYIDNDPLRFECGHYFRDVVLQGSCYSVHDFEHYDNIETVLTREEYNKLLEFSSKIKELRYGITVGDERYELGVKLCEEIQPIYDKLNNQENQEFFDKISQEEMDYLKEEYNISDSNIDKILDNYDLDYKDRSIICGIYDNAYDLGYEEALSTGLISNSSEWNIQLLEKYFDYENYGNDLIQNNDDYVELKDNRIVRLSYWDVVY